MIHNLGSKTTLIRLHDNAVVTATGAGTPAYVDLQGDNDFEGDIAFIISAAAAGADEGDARGQVVGHGQAGGDGRAEVGDGDRVIKIRRGVD